MGIDEGPFGISSSAGVARPDRIIPLLFAVVAGRTALSPVLSVLANSDALLVDDDQAPNKISVLYRLQKPIQSLFGLFDGSRPDPQADDARVAADWIHSGVSKVLVEGDDDGAFRLCSLKDGLVRGASEPDLVYVQDSPVRTFQTQEIADLLRNILIQQEREPQRGITCSSSTTRAAYSSAALTSSRVSSG